MIEDEKMSGFTKIAKTQIDEALKEMSRQYFVGNLHKNQTIEHLQDTAVEIGLTEYKEFSVKTLIIMIPSRSIITWCRDGQIPGYQKDI